MEFDLYFISLIGHSDIHIYIYNNVEAHCFKVIEPLMVAYSAVGAVQGVYSLPSNLFSSTAREM